MLLSIGDSLSKKKYVVVGRAGMDFYPDPPGVRTEEAERFVCALGGSAANIAVALTRFGVAASIVTCVSDDAIGRYALNQLRQYGVDARHVRIVGGEARTSLAVVESRVFDHQSVIYRNGAADFAMYDDDVAALDYTSFGGLIITGTVLAEDPSRRAGFLAIERARAAGLPIMADLDYRPYSWASAEEAARIYQQLAQLCDVVVGNDDEFAVMAGYGAEFRSPEARAGGRAFAQDLARKNTEFVVYKMGEAGCITFHGEDSFESGIFKVEALKPTGAGDSFMGGLIAELSAGRELPQAVRFASACAALVVTRVGCAPAMPAHEEVVAFMAAAGGAGQVG